MDVIPQATAEQVMPVQAWQAGVRRLAQLLGASGSRSVAGAGARRHAAGQRQAREGGLMRLGGWLTLNAQRSTIN